MFKITSKFEIAFLKYNNIKPIKIEITQMGLTYFIDEKQYEIIRKMYEKSLKIDLYQYIFKLMDAEMEIRNAEKEQQVQ